MNGIRRAKIGRGAARGGISMRALRDGLLDREDLINMTCAFVLRVPVRLAKWAWLGRT